MTEPKAKVMVAIQAINKDKATYASIYPCNLGVHNILAFDHPVLTHFDIFRILDNHPFNILLYLNADPEVINKLIDEDISRLVDHVFVTGCSYCIPEAIRLTEGFTYLNGYVDVDDIAEQILKVSKNTP